MLDRPFTYKWTSDDNIASFLQHLTVHARLGRKAHPFQGLHSLSLWERAGVRAVGGE
jgi:hypothetical protein